MYTLRNLSDSFLKNITVKIPHGLVSLIGPNGSGKSTLLNVLSGLKDYSGSAVLHGREVREFSSPRKKFASLVSFVMSIKNFRPSYPFSVREIIAMSRLPYRGLFSSLTKNDNEIIERSAEILGISQLLERNIMTLSDGERQMAFIACGLAQDTQVILLDEPTSSLDPDKSAKVFEILRNFADNGKCVITAVHEINVSMFFSDYYIALKNGSLISHGRKLNASVLSELYGTEFLQYHNDERNDSMWRALP